MRPGTPDLRIRSVRNDHELVLAHTLDAEAYGGAEAYYPLALYRALYRREPEMFWLLFADRKVVGSATLAPFGETWTRALLAGLAKEEDALPHDLDPRRPAPVWYFGGLQLAERWRGKGLGPRFAKAILEDRERQGRFAYPLTIIASAYSTGGRNVMRRFAFRPSPAAAAAGMPIYALECRAREELHAALDSSARRARRSAAVR